MKKIILALMFAVSAQAATITMAEFYTSAAAAQNGGGAAMETKIRAAVSLLNQDVTNSGVFDVEFQLVFVTQMDFSLTGAAEVLNSLPSDGRIQYFRNACAADLVGVWQPSGSLSFEGSLTQPSPAQGYHVIASDQDVFAYHLLSHEVGHNLGLLHDVASDTLSPTSIAHGYCGPGFRDVMAISCPGSTLAHLFSNPMVSFGGHPAGDSLASGAQMLRNMAPIVAGYR